MVIILAFLQDVETSREIFYYFDLWPVNPCLGPGFSVDIVSHSVTALVLVAGHTHHLWKRFPTSEALRKGGAFSEACKGFAEVRFLASHRTASAEARGQFPTNDAAASATRPAFHAILFHCSPGKLVTKQDRFIKLPPLFPTAILHLQGESFLQATDTWITASFGTGPCRAVPLEMTSAGTADCHCWSCRSGACHCQLHLKFSGSHKLKEELMKKSPSKK